MFTHVANNLVPCVHRAQALLFSPTPSLAIITLSALERTEATLLLILLCIHDAPHRAAFFACANDGILLILASPSISTFSPIPFRRAVSLQVLFVLGSLLGIGKPFPLVVALLQLLDKLGKLPSFLFVAPLLQAAFAAAELKALDSALIIV